ncbi:MAG: hypothetical protein WB497_04895, partial [Pseudolabrys sp.]
MDLVILFDWFTNERMDAALQATEWQQREMFLRLALMWEQRRNSAAKKHRPKRRLTQTLWSDEALRLQAEARPRLRGGCRDWSEN